MLRRDNHSHLWSDHRHSQHPRFQLGSTTVARRPCRTSSKNHQSTQVKWPPATGPQYALKHRCFWRSRPPQHRLFHRMKYSRHQPGQTNLLFQCYLPSGMTSSSQDSQDLINLNQFTVIGTRNNSSLIKTLTLIKKMSLCPLLVCPSKLPELSPVA